MCLAFNFSLVAGLLPAVVMGLSDSRKAGYKNTKKSVVKQKKSAKISLFTSILLISQSKI